MSIAFFDLTKKQINVLKGLGMSMLVFHNYIHSTNNIGENEVDFNPDRIFNLFSAISSNVTFLFNGIAAYFFHLALLLFIFASGYGLTKKCMNSKPKSYFQYLLPNLSRLYTLWIFGIIVCVFIAYSSIPSLRWYLSFAIKSLLLINNFSFNSIFTGYFGPWWYFAFAVQLYLFFPFVFYIIDKYKRKGFYGLFVLSYVFMFIFLPISNKFNFPYMATVFAHIPELVLGIGLAYFKELRFNVKIIIPTLLLFTISNFSEFFFPFSFLTALILLLVILYPIYGKLSESSSIYQAFLFLGSISMLMYVINGPLRNLTLVTGSQFYIMWGAFIHYGITIILAYGLSFVYKPISRWVDNSVCNILSNK